MKKYLPHLCFSLIAAGPAAVVACGTPATKLAAERSGDLSHVLADRRAPDTEHLQSCGDGALAPDGAATLRRGPYLQQTTQTSTLVVFTSSGEQHVVVDVTRPDGTVVASVAAEVDPNARPSGAWQGSARIDGLSPGTLYCYALRGLTARAGFRTAPDAGSDEPVRFIAFGDSGTGSSYQRTVMKQFSTVPFDFIVHTGDVAYNEGTLSQFEKGFFGVYDGLLRSFPVFAAAGNHDYATDDARPFRDVFMLPENGGDQGLERWFSFDWGNVHFVALDTETMHAEQVEWLENDLASTKQPWKIAFLHKPAFSSGRHGSDSRARKYFHPLFAKHGVKLVLNGHEHNYERVKPQDGVVYLVTGGGGRGTRSVGTSSFTAFSEDVLHFVHVEVREDELFAHAIDGTGEQFDSLRIARH